MSLRRMGSNPFKRTMTVKELMRDLYFLPQDMKIILSVDEEGNGYHQLAEVGRSYANPVDHKGYFWECHHPDDLTDDPKVAETDSDKTFTGDLELVLVLWP